MINFLATSKTALIFKHVLAGTVHFDVGLVVHTMQQWENNRKRHGGTHTCAQTISATHEEAPNCICSLADGFRVRVYTLIVLFCFFQSPWDMLYNKH